jgi:hypothetical protein
MTRNDIKLPEGYIPFEELTICSNQLINGKVPFQFKDNIPFLVGKGLLPQVWLFAPVTPDGKTWKEIVDSNKSMSDKIAIVLSAETNSVTITVASQTLIHVTKQSEQKAEITSLDLRPLGLNIYGDTNGLHIGTNLLSHNIFNNVHTMVAVG